MITLAEFLYLENVDETQSMTLMDNNPGLELESPSDFRNFFKQQGIQLRQQKIDTKTEKTLLLERFKSFRGSVDYANARKYIEDQLRLNKKLKDVQTIGGTIESITSVLGGIETQPADPFFNFVIRKILTGSENGTLPSEELRTILDKLIKESSKEYYDETSDLERDNDDRIKSFKNIFKNKGRLRVPILDERFLKTDFRYTIKTEFKSLPDAVSAETNVLRKAAEAAATDIAAGNDDATKKFLSDLSNLINEDGNSIVALKAKITSLEETIVRQSDIIQDQIDAEVRIDESLNALSIESANKSGTIQTLEESNKNLQEQLDTKLKEIESDIQKQTATITDSLDNLTKNVVDQANATNSAQDSQINDLKSKLAELDKIKAEKDALQKTVDTLIQKNNLKT